MINLMQERFSRACLFIGLVLFMVQGAELYGQIDFPPGSSFQYLKGSDAVDLDPGWVDPGFDDSGWNTDRGRMYIILGPPDLIYISSARLPYSCKEI